MSSLFPILMKQGRLFENCKSQMLRNYSYHTFVPLSNLFLDFPHCIHTNSQSLIYPSYHRRKKHEFDNPYASMLQSQRKRKASPQILLLDATEKIEAMTLENASKLALMKNLKLIKIEDREKYTQGNKPVYQLMTGKEYHDEIMKQKSTRNNATETGFKGEKAIALTANIGAHDLETKIKHMISWVQKCYQIKVTINGSEASSDDQYNNVISKIEEDLQECGGRVLQKVIKPGHLKCFINPPKSLSKTKSSVPVTETSLPNTS